MAASWWQHLQELQVPNTFSLSKRFREIVVRNGKDWLEERELSTRRFRSVATQCIRLRLQDQRPQVGWLSHKMLLSSQQVLHHGLRMVQQEFQVNATMKYKKEIFQCHFGSSPTELSLLWYELVMTSIPGAMLDDNDVVNDDAEFDLAMYDAVNDRIATAADDDELSAEDAPADVDDSDTLVWHGKKVPI